VTIFGTFISLNYQLPASPAHREPPPDAIPSRALRDLVVLRGVLFNKQWNPRSLKRRRKKPHRFSWRPSLPGPSMNSPTIFMNARIVSNKDLISPLVYNASFCSAAFTCIGEIWFSSKPVLLHHPCTPSDFGKTNAVHVLHGRNRHRNTQNSQNLQHKRHSYAPPISGTTSHICTLQIVSPPSIPCYHRPTQTPNNCQTMWPLLTRHCHANTSIVSHRRHCA
jgi:hypothetical protein